VTGVGIDAGSISLTVATLDLKLVQSIRGAMDTGAGRATPLGPAPNPAFTTHVEDRFEPRRVFHPTPRYEPRPVLHPTPRVDTGPVLAPFPVDRSNVDAPTASGSTQTITPSGIEPVWKSLPQIINHSLHDQKPPIIKHVVPPPVVSYKGLLLDFFV